MDTKGKLKYFLRKKNFFLFFIQIWFIFWSIVFLFRYWNGSKGQLSVSKKPGNWVPAQNSNWQRHTWSRSVCKEYHFRSTHESHGFVSFGYHQGKKIIRGSKLIFFFKFELMIGLTHKHFYIDVLSKIIIFYKNIMVYFFVN